MKKSTVVALIAALLCMISGALMLAIGYGMGGWAAALELADKSSILDLHSGINISPKMSAKMTEYGDYDLNYDADDIHNLEMDIAAANVCIQDNTKDGKIYVNIEGARYYCENHDGTIKLSVEGNNPGKSEVTVLIPQGYSFNSETWKIAASNVEIGSMISDQLDITVGAGDLEIDKLVGERATIEIGTGSLRIKNAKLEDMDISCGAGNVEMNGVVTDDFNIECALGNVSLTLKDNPDDHNINLEAALGNITYNGKDYAGIASTVEDNGTDSDYNIECAMGDIDISFKD